MSQDVLDRLLGRLEELEMGALRRYVDSQIDDARARLQPITKKRVLTACIAIVSLVIGGGLASYFVWIKGWIEHAGQEAAKSAVSKEWERRQEEFSRSTDRVFTSFLETSVESLQSVANVRHQVNRTLNEARKVGKETKAAAAALATFKKHAPKQWEEIAKFIGELGERLDESPKLLALLEQLGTKASEVRTSLGDVRSRLDAQTVVRGWVDLQLKPEKQSQWSTGWTVDRPAKDHVGAYTVRFDKPFADHPHVMICPVGDANNWWGITDLRKGYFTVEFRDHAKGDRSGGVHARQDTRFLFVAVGKRQGQ